MELGWVNGKEGSIPRVWRGVGVRFGYTKTGSKHGQVQWKDSKEARLARGSGWESKGQSSTDSWSSNCGGP